MVGRRTFNMSLCFALCIALLSTATAWGQTPHRVSITPPKNSHGATSQQVVGIDYDLTINPATVTQFTFPIWGGFRGLLLGNRGTSGANVTFTVNVDDAFWPGEPVMVAATQGIHAQVSGLGASVPTVWQFRARTLGGGRFYDSGLRLGPTERTQAVALGDIDLDGDLDAVVANEGGANELWNNRFIETGSLSFQMVQSFGSTDSFGVALGDLDNDGDLDVFFANAGTTPAEEVWFNDAGTFSDSGQRLGNDASRGVALADFDGDGDLDAAVANSGYPSLLYLNDGSGFFFLHEAMVANATAVATGTINCPLPTLLSDGETFVLTDGLVAPQVFEFNQFGGVTPGNVAVNLAGAVTANDVALAIAGAVNGAVNLQIGATPNLATVALANKSRGAFGNNPITENVLEPGFTVNGMAGGVGVIVDAYDIAAGDVTGDELIDAVFAIRDGRFISCSNTAGTWRMPCSPINSVGIWGYSVELADLNGDRCLDLIVGQVDTQKADSVWLNNCSGSFTNTSQTLGNLDTYKVRSADFDADGDLDFMAVNASISGGEPNDVWLNDGTGFFGTTPAQTLGNSVSRGVALGDLDNDGDIDAWEANIGTFPDDNVWLNNTAPVVTTNLPATVSEAASVTITSALLRATDIDDPAASGITFTLTQIPVNGELQRSGVPLGVGAQFSQADINGSAMSYRHNGSETTSDQFQFRVSDSHGSQTVVNTFSVVVTPVNDAPVVGVNQGATVAEGSSVVITSTQLRATDADDPNPAVLLFTMTVAPIRGQLLLQGTPSATFTQDDINNNRVSYQHNGAEQSTDVFTFNVRDDGVPPAVTAPQQFNITVTPTNDAPTVTTNTGATVNEGANRVVTSAMLAATDPDNTAAELTYVLQQTPVNGSLLLGAAPLLVSGTFTQSDINAGRVSYQHNGSETTSDSFRVVVHDPGNAQAPAETFSIAVTPVNDAPVVVTNTGVTVAESGNVTIDRGRLETTDVDNTPAQLTYTLTQVPINGSLRIGVTTIALNGTFTQVDINGNSLNYQQNGSQTTSDSFRFRVSDGQTQTAETVFAITISAVNNSPTVILNSGASVAEAGTVYITNSVLAATDPDDPIPSLVYTVLAVPANGTLRNGVTQILVGGTFTQGDLNAGNVISYQHDGSETTSDSFRFYVHDAGTGSSPAATFILTITPVNDPPQVVANLGLTLAEGATATITATALRATDAETAAGSLVFTVTQLVSYGALRRDGTPLALNGTFTQDDINTGKISYAHNGSENFADSFRYTVRDGGTPPGVTVEQTFAIVVTPANDPPVVLTNRGLILDEGTQQTITDLDLAATDVDNLPSSLTFVVLQAPVVGALRNGTTPVLANGTFTQGDVNSGAINYLHNGSETVSDSFQFIVRDTGGATTAAATFNIVIVPINDPPIIVHNTGLTVLEGGSVPLLTAQLQATDADNPTSALVYRLAAVPANGALLLGTTALVVNGTFTQANVDDGVLSYQHNGGETTADSIRFTVTDGTTTLPERVFLFTVTPVNDTPEILVNAGMTVGEGGTGVIANTMLAASDADNSAAQLRFRILALPTHGTLLIGSTPILVNGTFQQTDVDARNVSYQHDGSQTTSDTFRFEVSDGTAISGAANFNILVSSVNNPPTLVNNTPVTIDEGAAVTITTSMLSFTDPDNDPATLVYTVTAAPINGTLFNNVAPLGVGSIFTQDYINRGRIRYVHSGNEIPGDQFQFTVQDNSGNPVGPFDFSLTIRPINDPPIVITNAMMTVSEGSTTAITVALLNATDAEQDATQVTYRLVVAPAAGTLLLGATPIGVNGTFTQAQIGQGAVRYRHNGGENSDDTFSFVVTDGTATTAEQLFLIAVTPVNDAPTIARNIAVSVNEGGAVTIDNGSLRATDVDSDNNSLLFTITALPVRGALRLNSVPLVVSSTFTQADVNALALSYQHDGGESTSDSFAFNLRDSSGALTPSSGSAAFAITVRPVNDPPTIAVNLGATVGEGQTVNITSSLLRAADPDNGASELTYTITRLPGHGRLRNGITTLLLNGRVLQSDIDSNRFAYVNAGDESDVDSFAFKVRDVAGLETAEQTFDISVGAANDAPAVVQNSGFTVPEGDRFVFNAALLRAADPDHAVDTLVYSLRSIPGSGSLLLNNLALAVNDTFAQADIDGGLLSYQHNGSEGARDTFSFVVTDPLNASSPITTFTITVTAINDSPTLVNNGIILDEGARATINVAQLSATDPDSAATALIFTLLQVPAHGTLAIGGGPLATGAIFTQSALASGSLSYQHDGGESTADSFQFRVRDDLNAQTPDSTFLITITPVNDAPVTTTIPGQTIVTGATFTPIHLADYATDVDNVASQLTWSVSGNVNIDVTIDSASVAHLGEHGAGWVGSEVITFSVSDGAASASTAATFVVTATPNEAPVFVDPTPTGTVPAVTNRELTFTVAADDPEGATVIYGATGLPRGSAVDSTSGLFRWTPSTFDVGLHPLTLTASDGNLTATRDIIIDVTAPVMPDGGGPDAATGGDAGPLSDGGGCGCRAQSSDGHGLLTLLALLAVLLRRRGRK